MRFTLFEKLPERVIVNGRMKSKIKEAGRERETIESRERAALFGVIELHRLGRLLDLVIQVPHDLLDSIRLHIQGGSIRIRQ